MAKSKDPTYNKLTAYIKKISVNEPKWVLLTAQIKSMCKEYEIKYSGIQYALWYWTEVKGNTFYGDTLGIIPYIYDEAKRYYEITSRTKKSLANFDFVNETREVNKVIKKEEFIP